MLRVVTFNILFDGPRAGAHAWRHRAAAVAEQIRRLDPDVLGIQEALHHQQAELAERVGDCEVEGVGRDDGAEAGEYAPIFYRRSRFERADGGTFWLSDTPDRPRLPGRDPMPWGSRQNRIATWLTLRDRVGGATLLVVNTHFNRRSAEARLRSAEQVVAFVAEREAAVDGAVVMGDFNARSGTAPHDVLAGRRATAAGRTSTLVDASRVARRVHRGRLRTSFTRWTWLVPLLDFDHIFVSADRDVDEYRVVDEKFAYGGRRRYSSDHLPVMAVVGSGRPRGSGSRA